MRYRVIGIGPNGSLSYSYAEISDAAYSAAKMSDQGIKDVHVLDDEGEKLTSPTRRFLQVGDADHSNVATSRSRQPPPHPGPSPPLRGGEGEFFGNQKNRHHRVRGCAAHAAQKRVPVTHEHQYRHESRTSEPRGDGWPGIRLRCASANPAM